MWSGTGGYRFLYNATNTSEVFTGTDAPIIAGNLRLTTNTGSTWKTPTTGTLVVTGGAGISENLNVGGTTHLNGNVEIDGTVDIDANFAVRSGTTDKFTVASSTGNVVTEGGLTVNGFISLGSDANDTLTMNARVGSDLDPTGDGAKDLGQSDRRWKDLYLSGTATATTFSGNLTGNVTANSGTSTFNNITVNGLVTGNISGNSGTATQLATARNIGGVSFNGTADINLPGVNTAGNQDTSGTATQADNINIDEKNDNVSYQVTFSASNNAGYNRQLIDTDNGHFLYNPSSNTLSGLDIEVGSITATTFGTSSQNAYGARTVSTGNPTGGNNGDIHYKI